MPAKVASRRDERGEKEHPPSAGFPRVRQGWERESALAGMVHVLGFLCHFTVHSIPAFDLI